MTYAGDTYYVERKGMLNNEIYWNEVDKFRGIISRRMSKSYDLESSFFLGY